MITGITVECDWSSDEYIRWINDARRVIPKAIQAANLSGKVIEVLYRRFWKEETLRESADAMGYVTAERIRQLEAKGLRALRHRECLQVLEEMTDDLYEA